MQTYGNLGGFALQISFCWVGVIQMTPVVEDAFCFSQLVTPPKFNSEFPLKNDGWKTFAFPIG